MGKPLNHDYVESLNVCLALLGPYEARQNEGVLYKSLTELTYKLANHRNKIGEKSDDENRNFANSLLLNRALQPI